MSKMNIQEFCTKANTDALIKDKYVAITTDLLIRVGFAKKEYKGKADIYELSTILSNWDELKLTKEVILSSKEEKAFLGLLRVIHPEAVLRFNGKRTHYSLLTILRLIPEVNERINEIRSKNKVKPESVKRGLHQLFPRQRKTVDWFIESQREYNEAEFQGAYARLSQEKKAKIKQEVEASSKEQAEVWKGIQGYLAQHFPNLRKEVNNFRISLKLPEGYTDILIDYILYNRVNAFDVALNKSASRFPSVNKINSPKDAFMNALSHDEAHFEPYILLKVYGDTSRSDANKALDFIYGDTAGFSIKTLPAYNFKSAISNPRNTEWGLVRNAICYYLKKQHRLEPKEIQNIFKRFNIDINTNTIPRNITAVEKLLKIDPINQN